MRICFISHSGRLNGAETILLETIEILHDNGIDCRVILPATGEFSARLTDLGVCYTVLPIPSLVSSRKLSLAAVLKAAAAIAVAAVRTAFQVWRWKCDVVYTNTITTCSGALAAAFLGRSHVWHIQEFGSEDHGLIFHFGEARSIKLLASLSTSSIALSNALKEKFKAYIDESKISVVYPSMHIALQNNASSPKQKHVPFTGDVFRCVIVGQVAPGKRQEDAIQAVATLTKWGIDTELIIVGGEDSVYRNRLEEIIDQKGLRGRVSFVGQVPNASPFIVRADALLMCSKCEAFGRVTVEGMLAGTPVIGARSGATQELIREGRTGLLYTVGDPHDLAFQIRRLFEDREYAQRLGTTAQSWAETIFTKERYVTEMLPILETLSRSTTSASSRPVLSDARSAHRPHELNN